MVPICRQIWWKDASGGEQVLNYIEKSFYLPYSWYHGSYSQSLSLINFTPNHHTLNLPTLSTELLQEYKQYDSICPSYKFSFN